MAYQTQIERSKSLYNSKSGTAKPARSPELDTAKANSTHEVSPFVQISQARLVEDEFFKSGDNQFILKMDP